MEKIYPSVVIIGRPNVGKSTLFNRLAGKRKALVHSMAGTTRDRNEAFLSLGGKEFFLVDTGGWADDTSIFPSEVKKQMEFAIKGADLVLFVVDGKTGIHPLDSEINNILRLQNKKVLVVANKIDTQKDELKTADFYQLGIEEIIGVSAENGINIFTLTDAICGHLEPPNAYEHGAGSPPIRVILVGKPNVGKSSILNALCKQERCIVHNRPGTTREAIDISLRFEEQDFVLIDTPGLHRKHKFKDDMEYLSAVSAHNAMERAEVAVLVIDVEQGIGETEARVGELITRNRLACLLAVNKWDLVENREDAVKAVKQQLEEKLKFLWWSKVIFVSAKTGLRLDRIFSEVREIYKEYSRIIPEDQLKEAIRNAENRKPFSRGGKMLKIKKVEQIRTNPPAFSFLVNDTGIMHFSYKRYLENFLRERFGFTGTSLILKFHK